MAALAKKAEEYLGDWRLGGAVQVVETERRGDYLAALCTDGDGNWCMCVYDRDSVFRDRWRAGGGKPSLNAGELGSWNFGNSREAVIIFCGGDLPEEAAFYTFQNSGIHCPGRFVMTCCENDIQFMGLIAKGDTLDQYNNRDWIEVTARMAVEDHAAYKGKGPVLNILAVGPTQKPAQEVVTF